MRKIFGNIHAAKSWGNCESSSGPGSTRERAAMFLPELIALVRSLGTRTLLDAPCGDFNWASPLADAVDRYVGVDIVPALIRTNRQRWSSSRRQFLCRDMVRQPLPSADLVLSRDAFVHLSQADVLLALANLRRTDATYLLATTFVGDRSNEDIRTGEWRPLNMQSPPLNFPAPIALIDERGDRTDGMFSDKRIGVWRFADLPVL